MAEVGKNKAELNRLIPLLNQKKREIDAQDELIANLESQIDDIYNEMERLEQEIDMKDLHIRDLQQRLKARLNQKPEEPSEIESIQAIGPYRPYRGDEVDAKLAEYINEFGTPVPWQRVNEGVYMYGTKRVTVKYLRQNLIVKVGGGSMMLEEFIANYEDIEIAKMNSIHPGIAASVQNPQQAGLTKQQRVALARGGSPRGAAEKNAGPAISQRHGSVSSDAYR